MRSLVAFAAFALLVSCPLAGCTMGPDFHSPDPPKAQAFLPDQPPTFVAGGIDDSPAIAWTGSSVVLTAVGQNGDLYYWWQAAGSKTWHQQTVSTMDFIMPGFASRPSIAWSGSSVLITATTSNGWRCTV